MELKRYSAIDIRFACADDEITNDTRKELSKIIFDSSSSYPYFVLAKEADKKILSLEIEVHKFKKLYFQERLKTCQASYKAYIESSYNEELAKETLASEKLKKLCYNDIDSRLEKLEAQYKLWDKRKEHAVKEILKWKKYGDGNRVTHYAIDEMSEHQWLEFRGCRRLRLATDWVKVWERIAEKCQSKLFEVEKKIKDFNF